MTAESGSRTRVGSGRGCALVTGGAGFIGSHLVERLVTGGDEVIIVDDLSTGRRENLANVRSIDAVRMLEGRVSHRLADLEHVRIDRIFHLAAAVGVRLVIERPIDTIETNVLETSAILRFAAGRRIPILIASTSEVYGKSLRTPFREDDDVVYGPTIYQRWSYACSKAIDEYLALAYAREQGLPVIIARFFNTVGPRQVGDYGMVLPRFVAAALENRPLEVHGDGAQTRCFCDVRDVVRLLADLPECRALHGRVVNLGHDEPISIHALARLVVETLGSRSELRSVPYGEAFGQGFDDLRDRRPDLTRLRSATGFVPEYPLVQTIRDVASHLVMQREDSIL